MSQYTSYITSEHQKPKFLAVVNELTQPFDDIEQLSIDLNIDTATGFMLDILGGWIGQSRAIKMPLKIQPANWDTDFYGGWDDGVWFDEFDTLVGITLLDDDDYRFLLKLKIAQNHFNGTAIDIYTTLSILGIKAIVFDKQNMSCDIVFIGSLSQIQQEAIMQKIVNIVPFGVLVQYYAQVSNSVAIWDNPVSPLSGGWDTGEFAAFFH
jgi:hypothetical protein